MAIVVEGGGGRLAGPPGGLLASQALRYVRGRRRRGDGVARLALGVYRLAAEFGLSGPIAVVVAGMATAARPISSDGESARRSRLAVFWSLVDELLNTLLFLLMGFQIFAIPIGDFASVAVLAAIPLALLARLLSVAPTLLFIRLGPGERGRALLLMTWVGLRGAVSVALALNLPPSPFRDKLLAACYAVVIFTVVAQGLSTPRVAKALFAPREPGA